MRPARAAVAAAVMCAALGLAAFAALAWQSVRTEPADASEAMRQFEERRAELRSAPLVERHPTGRLIRRPPEPSRHDRPTRLHLLVYRSSAERLTRVDVPIWFVKMKGPAVDYAFQGTGFTLSALGLTGADLENAGAGLVLDDGRPTGDRLLVWTE